MKDKTISFILLLIAVSKVSAQDINRTVQERDFVPHVPSLAEFEKLYGKGKIIKDKTGISYSVYRGSKNICVMAKYESDLSDPDIEELIFIRHPICNSLPQTIELTHNLISSTHIGTKASRRPAESDEDKDKKFSLLGSSCDLIEFHPTKEPDLYGRYYLKHGLIIGFSLGVTE